MTTCVTTCVTTSVTTSVTPDTEQVDASMGLSSRLWGSRAAEMTRAISSRPPGGQGAHEGALEQREGQAAPFTLGNFAWGGAWLHTLAAAFAHPTARAELRRCAQRGTAVVLGSSLGFEVHLLSLVYAEITPSSRRAHAEITPRSRRDHAEITPRSRRDHAELTLSFRPFGEVDLPYPGYERRALSQHFPHYRYGVRVVGVELLCNLAELSAALQARDRRSTYDLGEVHIGRRALLCSGRTDCPASSPPLSARMRSTTASRRTPRWSMSTTRHGTLRGSRASPRGSPIS